MNMEKCVLQFNKNLHYYELQLTINVFNSEVKLIKDRQVARYA
jgi:hypothetical protein